MRLNNYKYLIYSSALAFSAAWLVSGWLSMSTAGSVNVKVPQAAASKRSAVKIPDINLIKDKNIFDADTGTVAAPSVESVKPEQAVLLAPAGFKAELLGVLTGAESSMAVISYESKKYILSEGVTQDGITLVETGFYHAVVKFGGKEYRLILANDKKNSTVNSTAQTSNAPGNTGTENFKISRKEVVEKLSDVNSVIKSVLIVPYEVNGEFQGYRVRRIAGNSVLRKLGIRRNDVIIRLNGKSLDTPTVFFDTLKNAENVSSVTLDILRANQKKTLYVEIEG